MTLRLVKLRHRIQIELEDIERAVTRARMAWQKYQTSGDELYLDSIALNLHSFYNGLERLFEGVATTVDNYLPEGSSWHKALLVQMAKEVSGVRPAVISSSTRTLLEEYCRFRHVVRNIYGDRLDPDQLQHLIDNVEITFIQIQKELTDFANWLTEF